MPTRSASSSCVKPAAARYVLRISPKEETVLVAIANAPLWNFSHALMRTYHARVFSLYHTHPTRETSAWVSACITSWSSEGKSGILQTRPHPIQGERNGEKWSAGKE